MYPTVLFHHPKLCAAVFTSCLAVNGSSHAGKDPIQGNVQGYWSHGVVIGSLVRTGTEDNIWPNKDVVILAGAYRRKLKTGVPTLNLSPYSKNVFSELEKKVKKYIENPVEHSKRVALHYLHPHPLNIYHSNRDMYWVINHTELQNDFSKSDSYHNYGYEFVDESPRPCKAYSGQLNGKIFHVSRWGFKSKVCTIIMEEDQLTDVNPRFPTDSDSDSDSDSDDNFSRTSSPSRTTQPYYHNHSDRSVSTHGKIKKRSALHEQYTLNIYTEEGCKFAEDAALHQAQVLVDYSSDCLPTWNWYSRRIYKIQVLNEKKKQ